MSDYEAELRLLALCEVVLQPACLLGPEGFFGHRAAGDIADITVQNHEMGLSPIERVVRVCDLEEIVELLIVPLVVSECGEECDLSEQFLLNTEEDRPLRGIGAVGHEVSGMDNE